MEAMTLHWHISPCIYGCGCIQHRGRETQTDDADDASLDNIDGTESVTRMIDRSSLDISRWHHGSADKVIDASRVHTSEVIVHIE